MASYKRAFKETPKDSYWERNDMRYNKTLNAWLSRREKNWKKRGVYAKKN